MEEEKKTKSENQLKKSWIEGEKNTEINQKWKTRIRKREFRYHLNFRKRNKNCKGILILISGKDDEKNKEGEQDKGVDLSRTSEKGSGQGGKIRAKLVLETKRPFQYPMAEPTPKKTTPVTPGATERKEAPISKKKKRFAISGYQRAGDSGQSAEVEVSSDTNLETPVQNVSSSTLKITEEDVKLDTPANIIAVNSSSPVKKEKQPEQSEKKLEIDRSITKEIPAKRKDPDPFVPPIHKFKKAVPAPPELTIQDKYCLPLCSYHYPEHSIFKPKSKRNIWGEFKGNRKVFIDLQLSFLFGFSSGRQFIEKYPTLKSRVCSLTEKEFLEKSVISQKLLKTMLLKMDRQWIRTTVIDEKEVLKLSEIDCHLVFWDEELQEMLEKKVEELEKGKRFDDWVLDEQWVEGETVQKSYVHKLKRFKSGK
jgi:hypothetical protein